ncbi:sigma-70 family RNA polymerase sigma factor [Fodinicola feengrottensis]|uniref:Sigma-70 family RNA polymerase sigma factor n=1 Tax=Fodinicola feengrottensis TaxID=435914 RepID=A0ABN2IP06_9ACTN|nr:sigma-70 family RNA polymerase sigma factor [Fodinicola feengrottensis]
MRAEVSGGPGEGAGVAEFEAARPRLFAIAYRLLGSASEAEDAVQDSYLRWAKADREAIAAPVAWLTKVVTNLCLTRLTSARARRERYVGMFLPEPIRTDLSSSDPLVTVEQRESLSIGMLVLLEQLTPAERAVFVLREAFSYGHREIAEVLDISEANSQQLLVRARGRLAGESRRFDATQDKWRELVAEFLAAATVPGWSGCSPRT